MTLQVGKQYVTKVGHRCVVLKSHTTWFGKDYFFVWHDDEGDEGHTYWHKPDGRISMPMFRVTALDIIGEWEEPEVYEGEIRISRMSGEFICFHNDKIRITIQGDKKTIEFVEGGE
jgi:hypothetical protein